MDPIKPQKPLYNSGFKDLFIIGIITAILIIMGLIFDWTERCVEFMYHHLDSPLDDISIPLVITCILLLIYAFRRNLEYKHFIDKIQQSENETNLSNKRLSMLLHSSSAILFNVKLDENFTMLYFSDNITSILGYSMEEAMAPSFWKLNLHPDEITDIFNEMAEMYQMGKWVREYHFKHKNGNWRWMHVDIKVIYDKANTPIEIAGVWIDITDKKETQEIIRKNEERLQLASRATRDVLYDWNLITNEFWISEQIFSSFGYDLSSKLNLDWRNSKIHPSDKEHFLKEWNSHISQEQQSFSIEYRFKKGDGTYAFIFDRAYIVYAKDGTPLRLIGSMYDVTEIKRTESELRIAKEKAEDSTKSKSEFLANMSHEIRTPLNGIIGMTDMMEDSDLNTEQQRYLDILKTSCNSLMSLINDILDFSKIDAGKLEISPIPFSLRDEISNVMQPLGLKASLKQLELIFSICDKVPDKMVGDIHRIQQIITNLIGNAIKFTEKGEIILEIQLKDIHNSNAILLFSVSDTGIGIPTNKLESVFEEFTQADGSTTRKYGGTGLGLTITKRLVELMQGSIWVESEENKGSTFSFTIEMELQPKQNFRKHSMTFLDHLPVLVVEDNLLSREHLIRILKSFRMSPIGVTSGEEALEALNVSILSGQPFPLIMLDLSLSGEMDGIAVAEHIKSTKELKDSKIIVVSMSQKANERERLSFIGVDHYFTKPFSPSDLLDCIQDILAKDLNISGEDKKTYNENLNTEPSKMEVYKILLVEDNLVNQEVATTMLTKKGHIVIIANNGEEAVELYKMENLDFILMDIQMPRMNGYEATKYIRNLEKSSNKHIPIIGLTANALKGDREKCLEAGMDNYISKPLRMNELFSVLEKMYDKKDHLELSEMNNEKPLVNITTLLENLGGDMEALQNILHPYRNRALAQFDSICQHIQNEKLNDIVLPAHSLKGQCMHVEMHKVISLAGKIETLATENKLDELKKLMPDLKVELTNGLNALDEVWSEIQNKNIA